MTSGDSGVVGEWLLTNAASMNESMFSNRSSWSHLEDIDILVMRAAAPRGVFTGKAKAEYLAHVANNNELRVIADALFVDDYEFVNSLPPQMQGLKPHLTTLMLLSYAKGVRPPDARVKAQ